MEVVIRAAEDAFLKAVEEDARGRKEVQATSKSEAMANQIERDFDKRTFAFATLATVKLTWLMSNFDLAAALVRIEKYTSNAWANVGNIEAYMAEGGVDDLEDYQRDALQWNLESILIELCAAFETLGLPQVVAELRSGFRRYRKGLTDLYYASYVSEHRNATLDLLHPFTEFLKAHLGGARVNRELELFERILEGTSKIVADRKLEPQNEKDVRNAVYDLLVHVFPDTIKDLPIPKVFKSYKPDIGVRSLCAAVEYKFAVSLDELKVAIGGILEDSGGYAGSNDWTTFYAVIYTAGQFATRQQIEAEFSLSKLPSNWKIFLVHGPGARVPKSSAKPRSAMPSATPKGRTKIASEDSSAKQE